MSLYDALVLMAPFYDLYPYAQRGHAHLRNRIYRELGNPRPPSEYVVFRDAMIAALEMETHIIEITEKTFPRHALMYLSGAFTEEECDILRSLVDQAVARTKNKDFLEELVVLRRKIKDPPRI